MTTKLGKSKFILVSSAVIIMVFFPVVLFANFGGGYYGAIGTGNFASLGTDQVEMQYEDLTIKLFRDHAVVDILYRLHNTGGNVTVKAGFPAGLNKEYQPQPLTSKITDYSILANEQKLQYSIVETDYISGFEKAGFGAGARAPSYAWLVSYVPFGSGETKEVKIHYETLYDSFAGGVSMNLTFDPDTFRYYLSTGSVWKGPIVEGHIHIIPFDVELSSLKPVPHLNMVYDGKTLEYTFANLEPTPEDDLEIMIGTEIATANIYNYISNSQSPITSNMFVAKDGYYYYWNHDYSVTASSTLKDQTYYYGASNVRDCDGKTCWVEGVKGDGIGEYLDLVLNNAVKLGKIGIIPGIVAGDKQLYFANNRIARLSILLNGKKEFMFALPDDYSYDFERNPKSYFNLDVSSFTEAVKTIRITIAAVYKGLKYDDTCISEIVLWNILDQKPQMQGR